MAENNTRSTVQRGPGLIVICTIITFVLAVLKMAGYLAITWFIVFLPLIIGVGVSIVILVLALIFIILAALVSGK